MFVTADTGNASSPRQRAAGSRGAWGPQVAVRVTGAASQACGPPLSQSRGDVGNTEGLGRGECLFILYLPALFVF